MEYLYVTREDFRATLAELREDSISRHRATDDRVSRLSEEVGEVRIQCAAMSDNKSDIKKLEDSMSSQKELNAELRTEIRYWGKVIVFGATLVGPFLLYIMQVIFPHKG